MNILKQPSRKPSRNSRASRFDANSRSGTLAPRPQSVDARARLVYNTSERAASPSVNLRVVALRDVLLHEQIETKRVARLIERLRADQLLKNPPIVVETNGRYILLDGATRITALAHIGCRDAVVQIVDYDAPGLTLETWNHLLIDLPLDDFFATLRQLPGVHLEPLPFAHAQTMLARRASIATILLSAGGVLALRTARRALADQTRLLNDVVAAYEGRGEMYRVAHTDLECLLAEHARLSALVVFACYRPDEIRQLALNGSKLPMGITRHVIPGRALRINIPLHILFAAESLAHKNAWLDEWMRTKMRERQVRFYQEPVFLFDE